MQTVKINKKAMGLAIGSVFLLFLCVLSYSTTGTSAEHSAQPVRDIRIRKDLEQRLKPVETNDIHTDVDGNDAKKSAEVIDDQIVKKIEEKEQVMVKKDQNVERQEFVKNMMLHAWNGYKNYSWGANEVRPIAKAPNSQAIFGGKDMPATIVDAADTLWIMGLKKEYQDARDYIKTHMDMGKATGTLSVFETTIRFLGGLLSLHALSGEEFYIEKAKGVADALLPAFSTASGIPKSNIDMKTHYASNYGWANGGSSILAEFGSLHLEFVYLSEVSKDPKYAEKVQKIRDVLDEVEKINGLYPNYMNPESGKWSSGYHMSLGALGDSFYEYLIKSWIQKNKTDEQAHRMYWDTSKAIQEQMVFKSHSGLTYVAELRNGSPEHKMGHLACFCVGMFALQAVNEKNEEDRTTLMKLAEELGKTCHESYIRTETHIGPEMFYFNKNDDATSKHSENGYILRPEVIEGFFYLWRLTGKPMYREWVWDAVTAMEKHCKKEGGYAGLRNVYNPSQGSDDVQQSFFLAETLKYAYLTFTDNDVISLDKWVFNTEAHPFPILVK